MSKIQTSVNGQLLGFADEIQIEHDVQTLESGGFYGPSKRVAAARSMRVNLTGMEYAPGWDLPPRGFNCRSTPEWLDKPINDHLDTPKGTTMKATHLAALLAQGYTTVHVSFGAHERKNYVYKAKRGVKVGDKVIVDTPRNGLTVADVVLVDDNPKIDVRADFDYKWIVGVVDLQAYRDQMAREAEFLQALEEVEQARAREEQLKAYRESLPVDTEARKLFEAAVAKYTNALPKLEAPTDIAFPGTTDTRTVGDIDSYIKGQNAALPKEA